MHSVIWCFVWRDGDRTQWAFHFNIRWFMRKGAGESGPRNDTGASLKEQNYNFAESIQ